MAFNPERKTILVIGAGCSGLTAIKACLEEDQTPVCFEKTLDVGGLWRYSDDPSPSDTAGIYRSLVINTCKEMLAFSDFPVPDHLPQFLTHDKVLLYFRLYAEHFDLLRHIRFNTEVRHVRKSDDHAVSGRWTVTYIQHASSDCVRKCHNVHKVQKVEGDGAQSGDDVLEVSDERERESKEDNLRDERPGQTGRLVGVKEGDFSLPWFCRVVTEDFDGVLICTGHHTVPYLPSFPGTQVFRGRILHSQEYKVPEHFHGQRVLVVGIGNSAVDIASDLAKTAKQVFLSTRRGSWIVPRTALWGIPADMLANSRAVFCLPARFLEWCVEKQANLRMDHELLGLKPRHGLLGAHPTINDEIPFHLMNGRVQVRADVAEIHPQSVQFQDDTMEDVDAIIMATGYDYRLDFVDPEVIRIEQNQVDLYLYVFPTHLTHPTLAVIGLVQAIGAVMPISEIQSRWFVSVMLEISDLDKAWSGDTSYSIVKSLSSRVQLPPREKMEEDVAKKQKDMDAKYYQSRRHTVQTFWIDYMDQVAMQLGVKPNIWRLLFTDPELAIKCYLGPCLPAQYRLQGLHTWLHAASFIKGTMSRTFRRHPHVQAPRSDDSSSDSDNKSSEKKSRQSEAVPPHDDVNIITTAKQSGSPELRPPLVSESSPVRLATRWRCDLPRVSWLPACLLLLSLCLVASLWWTTANCVS